MQPALILGASCDQPRKVKEVLSLEVLVNEIIPLPVCESNPSWLVFSSQGIVNPALAPLLAEPRMSLKPFPSTEWLSPWARCLDLFWQEWSVLNWHLPRMA